MAWTEQCKFAFCANAQGILDHNGGKGLIRILKELSKESAIAFKTLERWWYGQKRLLNNEGTSITDKNDRGITENQVNQVSHGGKREGAGRKPKNQSQKAVWQNSEKMLREVREYMEKNFKSPPRPEYAIPKKTQASISTSLDFLTSYLESSENG